MSEFKLQVHHQFKLQIIDGKEKIFYKQKVSGSQRHNTN